MTTSSKFGLRDHLGSLIGINFAFIVFIVVSLWSMVPARTAQAGEETVGEAVRVMALETLWNQAEVDKDIRALGQLVPDTFIYVDIDGSLRTKPEFLESVKSGTEKPSEIRNESMVAHAYGNTAVVTSLYREKGIVSGKYYSRRGRFTDTWIKVDTGWQGVASQSTLIEK
jgi:ketosteroid isomerase-like protein